MKSRIAWMHSAFCIPSIRVPFARSVSSAPAKVTFAALEKMLREARAASEQFAHEGSVTVGWERICESSRFHSTMS